jgi:hypothetical protein
VKKKKELERTKGMRRIDGGWFKAISGFKVEIVEKRVFERQEKNGCQKIKIGKHQPLNTFQSNSHLRLRQDSH